MVNNYSRAYTEILEYIYALPITDYKKIPAQKIEYYEQNKDQNYSFTYNPELSLEEQNVSRETKAILVSLYNNYFASEKEKQIINSILKLNEKKFEKAKELKYDINNIFNEKSKSSNDNVKNNQQIIVVNDNGIINRIKNFFKKLLKLT